MTNCINCGAPLHGGKCEYCGTEYENSILEKMELLLSLASKGIKPEHVIRSIGLYNRESYRGSNGVLHR